MNCPECGSKLVKYKAYRNREMVPDGFVYFCSKCRSKFDRRELK